MMLKAASASHGQKQVAQQNNFDISVESGVIFCG